MNAALLDATLGCCSDLRPRINLARSSLRIPKRTVVPSATGKLGHDVGAVSVSPGHQYLVGASSKSTRVSLFSAASGRVQEVDVKCKLDCLRISIDASGERLAFVEQGQLCVFDLATERLERAISLDHGDPGVVRYPLPFDLEQTRLAWPDYDEDEGEDERPGYHCYFLDEVHAVVGSSEGRMFVFDSANMEFLWELEVEGHAPVPLAVKYPTLAGSALVSNLIAFDRRGHSVVAFFAESLDSPASYVVLPNNRSLFAGGREVVMRTR